MSSANEQANTILTSGFLVVPGHSAASEPCASLVVVAEAPEEEGRGEVGGSGSTGEGDSTSDTSIPCVSPLIMDSTENGGAWASGEVEAVGVRRVRGYRE